MSIERWDYLNESLCELHTAIKKVKNKKHGPERMSHRDAKKVADEFASLMLMYGIPEFVYAGYLPKRKKAA